MKRVLQKQKSALKFLAFARTPHRTEAVQTKTLLTANESNNLFMTLEENYYQISKMMSTNHSFSSLENKIQKMWILISTIRKNEIMLREMFDTKEMKPAPIKSSKTEPSLKTHVVHEDDILKDGMMDAKSTSTKSLLQSESEILARKEMFEREKQHLLKEIINLKEKLMKCNECTKELNKKINCYEEQIKELKSGLESQTYEIIKETKLRQQLENRFKEQQKQIEFKEKEIENLGFQLHNTKEQIKLFESTINEQKLANELLSQNNSHLSQKIVKLQTEYNSQTTMLEELTQKCTSLSNQAKIFEDNASKMLTDINKNSKLKEISQKKIQLLEIQKRDLLTEKDKLTLNINVMKKEIEDSHKLYENEKKIVEDLKREKELFHKHFERVNATNDEQSKILNIEIRIKDQLEAEVNQLNKEIYKLKDTTSNSDKEKERIKSKNTELQNKVNEMRNYISEKESEILDVKKQLNDLDVNYKHQSSLLEIIRNDKNTYSLNLTQMKEEINNLKHRIKILTQQIDDEKENMSSKENELLKEKSVLQKLEQDKEKLQGELVVGREKVKNIKEKVKELLETENNLKNIIQKMEAELQKKEKKVQQVIIDEELISAQLLQKTEETTKLNAKIKLLENIAENQDSECKLHLEEIRNLKSEVKRLKTDKAALNRNLSAVANLRSEVFALERELTKQRVKCVALEEELQNPLNIHRWRKLEGTDPNMYELVTKIQLLQKRILTKSEIAAEKDQQLKDLEILYENLKHVTTKLSPAEINNKLYFLRKESEDKSKKIKNLMVENSMYEAHAAECKLELEQKNKELEEMKKEYFKQKQTLFKMRSKSMDHGCPSSTNNKTISEVTALEGGFSILPMIKVYEPIK